MSQPNIILIIFDDLAFEQIQRMPQLQKLSKTGVSFLNCYTTTPLCQPARKTLLTGQYSHNHGVIDNGSTGMAALDTTTLLNNVLHQKGYKTCHVGKYDNTYTSASSQPVGWDEWHGIAPQMYFGYNINDNGAVTTGSNNINDYYTNKVNDRALSFINSTTQPFFMHVSFKCPHSDVPSAQLMTPVPSPVYAGVTPGSVTAPRNSNFNVKMGTPPTYMSHAAMDGTTTNTVDAFWRGQTEMLYSADQCIANIISTLNSTGKTNTIFVITCDHGLFHGEGIDPCEKIAPYLPALHIPLIIAGPSTYVSQNKACSALVGNIDVVPTIYALLGYSSPRTMDGVSLVPLLTNPTGPEIRSNLFLEWMGIGSTGWGVSVPQYRSVLSKTMLYTIYGTGEGELYNLQTDPYQLTNLVNDPAYALTIAQLSALMTQGAACLGGNCLLQ